MNRSDAIKASIAARTEDLANLKSRSTASFDATQKRAHRLDLMDIEMDIQDLTADLVKAEAEARSAFSVQQRANGRARKTAVAKVSRELVAEYAALQKDHEAILARAARITALHRQIASDAVAVQSMDPVSRNSIFKYEEAQDVQELASGQGLVVAGAVASAIRALLDSLPCGRSVQRRFLVLEPMADWRNTPIVTAVAASLDQLAATLAPKCEEPEQERSAA